MCTLLAGNLFISLAGSEEQINFSQQSPKMFKIASDIFIRAFLLFLGLFFKIFCWVPLFSHITPLMYELHWLPLKQRIHFKILLFAFKAIHGIAPTYIQNLVSLKSQGTYNLRSSGWILLASSTFRTKITLGDRSFQVAAPKLWYALPRELRDIPSLHTFKSNLKTYLFKFADG